MPDSPPQNRWPAGQRPHGTETRAERPSVVHCVGQLRVYPELIAIHQVRTSLLDHCDLQPSDGCRPPSPGLTRSWTLVPSFRAACGSCSVAASGTGAAQSTTSSVGWCDWCGVLSDRRAFHHRRRPRRFLFEWRRRRGCGQRMAVASRCTRTARTPPHFTRLHSSRSCAAAAMEREIGSKRERSARKAERANGAAAAVQRRANGSKAINPRASTSFGRRASPP